MPLIEVKLLDRRLDDETRASLIADLTHTLVAALGESAREEDVWVILHGIAPDDFGVGGRQLT